MTEFIMVTNGNILKTNHDSIVIPVNTKRVMGAGLAKQFSREYPRGFGAYQAREHMEPGKIYIVDIDGLPLIFFMTTKDDWRDPSKLEWVISALKELKFSLTMQPWLRDVGIPKVGCGLGGLDWNVVKPHILKELEGVTQHVHIYEKPRIEGEYIE
jgi:hypothetical protein